MLEMALAALLVTVAIFAIGGRAGSTTAAGTRHAGARFVLPESDDGIDLPCPWCRAQTREADDHCPSCGQRFG